MQLQFETGFDDVGIGVGVGLRFVFVFVFEFELEILPIRIFMLLHRRVSIPISA